MVLWEPGRVAAEIGGGIVFRNLPEGQRGELAKIEFGDLRKKVIGALKDPKPVDISHTVFGAVLAAQYYEVFGALGVPKEAAVYEPCVGGSVPVIVAAESYSEGRARYFTINLNKKLAAELKSKIGHLRMSITLIEDNAQRALSHLQPGRFDVACFHHAVNDILETAVSEPRGMDTTAIDWWPNERQMIEWLAEDHVSGRIEQRGKPELRHIIADAIRLVRPGGHLVFDHFNWCRFIGVDWFPWDLFYNLIPMTRRWVFEAGMPVEELKLPGADPQWWMFLRRADGGG